MSCSYSDIAMAGHDSKALMYDFPPKVWKRFRDDGLVVWTQNTAKLPSFLITSITSMKLEKLNSSCKLQMK